MDLTQVATSSSSTETHENVTLSIKKTNVAFRYDVKKICPRKRITEISSKELEARKELRKKRNRVSAQKTRDNKKSTMLAMSEKIKELECENLKLRGNLEMANKKNMILNVKLETANHCISFLERVTIENILTPSD